MMTATVVRFEEGKEVKRGFEIEQYEVREWYRTIEVEGSRHNAPRVDYQRPDGTWGHVQIGSEDGYAAAVFIENSRGTTIRAVRISERLMTHICKRSIADLAVTEAA